MYTAHQKNEISIFIFNGLIKYLIKYKTDRENVKISLWHTDLYDNNKPFFSLNAKLHLAENGIHYLC